MPEWLSRVGTVLAAVLDRIPFPRRARAALDPLRRRLRNVNDLAPLVVAALAAAVAVRLVLWLARIPLVTAWQIFGAVSGHDVDRLAVYNMLAQVAAFVVAVKVFYEIARGDR